MQRRRFSHRAFWSSGYGAEGLSRDILRDSDYIVFDNGREMPAHAHYASSRGLRPHGPMRELTSAQACEVERRRGYLANVRADGMAIVVEPCGHYAPIIFYVDAHGYAHRTN